jgi:hypothetical protein
MVILQKPLAIMGINNGFYRIIIIDSFFKKMVPLPTVS